MTTFISRKLQSLCSQLTPKTHRFVDAIKHIPNSVLPDRRKKRGFYLFNPKLSIKIEGNWINIYDLLPIDKLAHKHMQEQQWWSFDMNE